MSIYLYRNKQLAARKSGWLRGLTPYVSGPLQLGIVLQPSDLIGL